MIIRLGLIFLLLGTYSAENIVPKAHVHGRYQHKGSDGRGAYNFAYDTGTGDAHSMRMEYKDDNGIVRGRYGYTDPKGKLRVVEYEAGPHGYHARGDVGPDEEPHKEFPVHKPLHLSPLRAAGWNSNLNPIHEKRVGHTAVVEGGTIDHPVKGYQLERTQIYPKEKPVVIENIKQPVTVKTHGFAKVPHHIARDKHHVKEVQPLIAVPLSTGKNHQHLSTKDIHNFPPHPAVSKVSENPVLIKTAEHLSRNHKTTHYHPTPVKNPIVIEKLENPPPKVIAFKQPAPVLISEKSGSHKIHEHKHPLPIATKAIANHEEKGHQLTRTAVVKSPIHEHIKHPEVVENYKKSVVAPVVLEKIEQVPLKSLHSPKPIGIEMKHVEKVEHHPRKSHNVHVPVPLKKPIIVESLEDHKIKGYQPMRPVHSKTHHHPDAVLHQHDPPEIKTHSVVNHADRVVGKHIKSERIMRDEPVHVEKVEYHPKVASKGGSLITKEVPVMVSRLEYHNGKSNHLPAEHRDVDIILEPTLTYSKTPKSKTVLQPLTIHNIDVNPKEIRTTATDHRHHSENYHHPHPNTVTRVSSSSSIHRHSADDYHMHHSPRNHLDSVNHRAYENYHANHPPQVPHRHSNRYYHGNHTHSHPVVDDRPPIVVTSISVSSDDMVMHDSSAPRVLARTARHHSDHSHEPRPVRYRPWSIYSPGSFYWR